MNWEYLSGFFDADGSIFLTRENANKNKSIGINFANTDLNLLKSIQKFIYEETKLKGYIKSKKKYKENHTQAYHLDYQNHHALKLCYFLNSKHHKKSKKIELCISQYLNVTSRNGKYTSKMLEEKLAFETKFNSL